MEMEQWSAGEKVKEKQIKLVSAYKDSEDWVHFCDSQRTRLRLWFTCQTATDTSLDPAETSKERLRAGED